MLKILTFTTIILFTLSSCKFTDNNNDKNIGKTVTQSNHISFCGSAHLKEMSYASITINGTAKLDNVTVTEKLTINGSLLATKSTIHTINANGKIDLQKTTINGPCKINGYLNAQNSTLDQIIVSSERITFYDSTTKTITIKKTKEHGEQIVELNSTKVDGNIVFEGGNGKVLSTGNSEITGKIDGGTLEKR